MPEKGKAQSLIFYGQKSSLDSMSGHEFVAAVTTAGAVFVAILMIFAWGRSAISRRKQLKEAQAAIDAEKAVGKKFETDLQAATRELRAIQHRFKDVLDLDLEAHKIAEGIDAAKSTLASLEAFCKDQSAKNEALIAEHRTASKMKEVDLAQLEKEIAVAEGRYSFIELGVYEPHFDFTDSEDYKQTINQLRVREKLMISAEQAVVCTTQWTLNGSESKGRDLAKKNIRLTLRAFNNECDVAIANTRWNNALAMERRITKAREQIDKLNVTNQVKISESYSELKLEELRVTHEYREKLKAERELRAEAARRAREEQKLLRDLEDAQKDEEHYQRLLDNAKAEAASITGPQLAAFKDQVEMLERDLKEAQARAERAKSLAEETRCGYIYVISNIGSFGEGVVKIGLTRRLDPMDRVRELGDASVPFTFDTHAIIYSDNAPDLERQLHLEFEATRINTQNFRKEFFRVSLDAVEEAIKRIAPKAAFFKDVEAQEFRETLAKRQIALAASRAPAAPMPTSRNDNSTAPELPNLATAG